MGRMIRGISKNSRFFVLDSTDIVQEGLRIHKTDPILTDLFGQFLSASVILGSTLKGEDILTLRVDKNDSGSMVVVSDSMGNVKGYVTGFDTGTVFKDDGSIDKSILLKDATLKVIKDFGLKLPYIGISSMETGNISNDLAEYYFNSEQIKTVISLGVKLKDPNNVEFAGAFVVQLLPNADEKFIDFLEEKIKVIYPMTELMKGGMTLERIAKLIYDDISKEENIPFEEYEILEEKEVNYSCNCNKEKFFKGVLTLGKDEIQSILEDIGFIEVKCHFCDKEYKFVKEDFSEQLI